MSEVYSIILRLKALDNSIISPTQGYHAFALFLSLISHSNALLAQELHSSTAVKPFTLSPLLGKYQKSEKNLQLIQNDIYTIRLTFLTEIIFCAFMDSILKAAKQPLRLENALFSVEGVLVNPLESPNCDFRNFADLIEKADSDRRITLQFDSITTFRSGDKRNIIFPLPSLLLGSYFNKWQYYSHLKMPETILSCWEKVRLSRYKLETHILHFNGYQETGFTGTCGLDMDTSLTTAEVKLINTLVDFAYFSGSGAKTTMGMGQTRRINEPKH